MYWEKSARQAITEYKYYRVPRVTVKRCDHEGLSKIAAEMLASIQALVKTLKKFSVEACLNIVGARYYFVKGLARIE